MSSKNIWLQSHRLLFQLASLLGDAVALDHESISAEGIIVVWALVLLGADLVLMNCRYRV
jgi:hypothetical protein